MRLNSLLPYVIGAMLGAAASAAANEGLYSNAELGRRDLPGEPSIAEQLQRKARALDVREQTISDKEEKMREAEGRLREKLSKSEALRDEIQNLLTELDTRHDDQIARQIKTFEKMRGSQAAPILAAAREADALLILSGMRPDKVAKILAAMPPDTAARLTERLNEDPANGISGI
ncbi:MAG: hypothetical protein AAFV53_36810 [Myxococcota bacterium]